MYGFQYVHPSSLYEAVRLLQHHQNSCVIAGGTDLLLQYRKGKRTEEVLIDILLPELIGITETDKAYLIGTSTNLTDVANYFCKAPAPYVMLQTAADNVGACQTRNLATIGGNICTGNASSDMATALLVLDAKLMIASACGQRILPIDCFFLRNRQIALARDEIVTAIQIPKLADSTAGAAFLKIGKRRGHVIATLNAAAMIERNTEGVIQNVRLAVGTLAPKPIRLYSSEALIKGQLICEVLTQTRMKQVMDAMLKEIQPRDSLRASKAYRMQVAPVALERVIRVACSQGGTEKCG